MSTTILKHIIEELSLFFEPISQRLRLGAIADLMAELGWNWPEAATLEADEIINALDFLNDVLSKHTAEPDFPEFLEALKAAIEAINSIHKVPDLIPNPNDYGRDDATILKEIRKNSELVAKRAVAMLFVKYLTTRTPALLACLQIVGVLKQTRSGPNDFGPGVDDIEFNWGNIPKLVYQPNELFGDLYKWGQTTAFKIDEFLQEIEFLAITLGLPALLKSLPFETERSVLLAIGETNYEASLGACLEIPLLQTYSEDLGSTELGLRVFGVPDPENPSAGTKGIALVPFANGKSNLLVEITDSLQFSTSGNYDASFAVLLLPGGKVKILEWVGGNSGYTLDLGVALTHEKQDGPLVIFGEKKGTRFEYSRATLSAGFWGSPQDPDFFFELLLSGASMIIQGSDGNGFLQKLFPKDPLVVSVETTIGVSSARGFYFGGSGGFEVTLPLHKKIGPVEILSVYLSLLIKSSEKPGVIARVGTSAKASLGPVTVSIGRVGVTAGLTFPENGKGNLGSANLDIGFLPPTGVGLTVKAAGVTGGGYLSFDKANHIYSGALQLQFAKVGLDAIGFITTGGPEGFSLVININTRFTPPVQLSFGFMLVAVGGLIAINRTMSVEALQAGMLDGTLDSLLFPPNPVAQAPRIIQDLQRVLPAQDGRYVVGPMLRLTWGAKSLVKIDLGLFFELPNPLRMLLAGQLDVAVPHEDKALIKFHAAILGLLDLGRKVLAIDTRIKEGSHIVGFEVLGDTALRLSWGEKPYFLLSMGGFHPKFPVPAVYPALPQPFHRLSLVFDELKFFHLSCESYFAITSNSLQFGANANLYVKLTKRLKVEGYLGYDTLIMFSPFFFEVGIRAGVAVKWKKRTLMGVALEFTLSGPRPWRAKGKGKIKILFIKISIGFDVSWGTKDPVLLDTINPVEVLQQALEDPDSWGSLLPPHHLMGEALDPFERLLVAAPPDGGSPETPAPSLIMHPAGTLEIRQKVVPLGIRLDTLQNAPVTKANRVVIDHVTVGNQVFQDPDLATSDTSNPVFTPVEEHFAPCQFVTCPPDARLTKPAFELMEAGVSITSGAVAYATPPGTFNEAASLEYESLVIDEDLTTVPGTAQPARVMPRGVGKGQWLGNAAVSRARRALRPFQSTGGAAVKQRVRLAPPAYQVLEYVEATGTVQPMQAEALRPYRAGRLRTMTRLEADQVVSAIHQQHPDRKGRYAVLPETEVVL